jgi:hypothetical protein
MAEGAAGGKQLAHEIDRVERQPEGCEAGHE